MQAETLIAPSVLSADFGCLNTEIAAVEQAGADWIHLDVMDGRFVPNITFGPGIVKTVRKITDLTLDVHLMIAEPDRYVADFVKAGADVVSVHAEACQHLHRTLNQIRDLGARAGVVLNPATPEDMVRCVLDSADLILIMSVNPGFGGQSFLPSVLPKLQSLQGQLDELGFHPYLEIDGGISSETAERARSAGAQVLVAGSAVFGAKGDLAPDAPLPARVACYERAIKAIRDAANGAGQLA